MRFFLTAALCSVSMTVAQASEPVASTGKPTIVPTSAPIVEITKKSGPVTRVNTGKGMVDAKVGDSLKAGDQVFAGPNSSVVLYFTEAQCTYKVKASSVYRVTGKAPCKTAAGAGAGAGAAAGVGTGVAVGVGAIAIGGAIALIATTENGNSNKKPITPN